MGPARGLRRPELVSVLISDEASETREAVGRDRARGARTAVHRRGVDGPPGQGRHRGDLAAHRGGHRTRPARVDRGRGPGGRRRAPGVRRRTLAPDEPRRADRGRHPDQGRDRGTARGDRPGHLLRERLPVLLERPRAGPRGDDGVGRGAHGRAELHVRGDTRRRPRADPRAARAGGRGRGRGAVERAAVRGGRQARARAADRLHGRTEAVARVAPGRLSAGRDREGGRAAGGCPVDPARRPRGQRVPGRTPRHRQGLLHRIGRGGPKA